MDIRKLLGRAILVGVISLAPLSAAAVTYTYTSPVLNLQNPLDPSSPAGPMTHTYSFWFDENYLGGTTAGTMISVRYNGFLSAPSMERAYRRGNLLPYDFDLNSPIATTTMGIESLGGWFRFTFDTLGEVASFSFGTDGEFSSISFSDRGASVYGCTICDYTPYWRGIGPGTWVHDPVAPIPVVPALPLALTGLLMLSGTRRRFLRGRFNGT